VSVRIEPQATREPVDGTLQIAVIERHQAPAGIAQEVMMMSAGRVDQLVTGHAGTQIQARDQPPLLQKLQDAVDARARHPTLTGAKPIFDLQRAQCARLVCEEVDDGVARTAFAMSRLIEHSAGVLGPLQSADVRHRLDISLVATDSRTTSCFQPENNPAGSRATGSRRGPAYGLGICTVTSGVEGGQSPCDVVARGNQERFEQLALG